MVVFQFKNNIVSFVSSPYNFIDFDFQKQAFTAHDSDDDNHDIKLGVVVDSDDNEPVENTRTSGRSKAKGKKKNGAGEYFRFQDEWDQF